MRENLKDIIPKLDNVKKVGSAIMARCPAHDDKHQSLSIDIQKNLIYCHAGCSFDSIVKTLGLNETPPQREIVATYDYTNEEGKLVYQVVRYEPKSFTHRRPDGQGGWIYDRKGIEPLLYNLPLLRDAVVQNRAIYIVEGEKDCETLKRHSLVATTCSGGVKGWRPQFTELFRNANVIIIPDNDDPGIEYAYGIGKLLYGWAKSLKIINPNTEPHADITDWLGNHTVEKLQNIIDNAPQYIPSGAVTRDEMMAVRGHLIYLSDQIRVRKGRDNYFYA